MPLASHAKRQNVGDISPLVCRTITKRPRASPTRTVDGGCRPGRAGSEGRVEWGVGGFSEGVLGLWKVVDALLMRLLFVQAARCGSYSMGDLPLRLVCSLGAVLRVCRSSRVVLLCRIAERPGTVGFLAACLTCVVAVSYSPTTCRLQYHWRCRA